VGTGLPVYAVLLGSASVGALLGLALGAFTWPILGAMPTRIVGLLEHDLLQALPLYALIGALLNRLPLAELLQRAGERVFARCGARHRRLARARSAATQIASARRPCSRAGGARRDRDRGAARRRRQRSSVRGRGRRHGRSWARRLGRRGTPTGRSSAANGARR